MQLNDYQYEASKTAIYPAGDGITYTALGLAGEAGEVANKVKKWLRGDMSVEDLKNALIPEIGDCLWYIAMLSAELGYTLEDVAQANLEKLAERKKNGTLKGSGDVR